ncbi:helix-turn-helix domain-containing protein [Streptomyces sp. NBC_00669]|uniref:IclR family transcriptional regulator domain-containing protein n=1 Tax=Streptomyces sp. NBC_00669 TaxID=2976011 RepID=UPI002E36C1DF|nr:IclR family transcriptional regulator C-terminal domain-containing protein [Streptomyces sp. NBC_00669]
MPRPTATAEPAPPPAEAVGPLIRGLAVLRVLGAADGRRSVGDLVRDTGLARSTVDRVVSTLARTGYLRVEGRDAVLAPRLMELGNAYLSACGLPDRLGPLADALADRLDESVSLAVPDRDGVRFVAQATRRRAMSLVFRIGDLLPAECGAPGALFAAEWTGADWERWRRGRAADPAGSRFPALPPYPAADAAGSFDRRAADARRQGWSVDDQLIEPGLVAIAMPVRDASGRAVCAVSVVSHTSRHSARSLGEAVLPRLRTTVAAMEAALSGTAEAGEGTEAGGLRGGAKAGALSEGTEAGGLREGAKAGALSEGTEAGALSGDAASGGPAEQAEQSVRGGPAEPAAPPPDGPAADGPVPAAWTRASKQELGPEFVESLARGLTVLTAFDRGPRAALPLTAVAEATGLARATARRSLITLEHLGYVAHDGRLFRPTPRVLELGFAHLSHLALPQIAQPHLVALVGQVRESASMAVLSGDDIQYVARVPTVRIMSVNITVGTRFPAYATSMGRVLLSGLPAAERARRLAGADLKPLTRHTVTSADRLATVLDLVERDRYALVDEELEEGLRSIAVPVRDRAGRGVAAVNVSMHAAGGTAEQATTDLLPPLRQAAERITADLRVAGRYGRLARE